MSINKDQFRMLVWNAVSRIDSKIPSNVCDLLMLTAATESELGTYIFQLDGGPAKGVFQMEPIAIKQAENRLKKVAKVLSHTWGEYDLLSHAVYARAYYTSFTEPIPSRSEYVTKEDYWWALAIYYKKYWNTYEGKNTVEKAYNDSKRLVWG